MKRALLLAASLAVTALPAAAQRWRTLDATRQLRDTTPLRVNLEYAAGKLDVRPADAGALYTLHLRYDADRSDPLSRFDSAAHALSLGVRSHHMSWHRGEQDAGEMAATLSSRVPMDLTLEVGAVEAQAQLGGLRLTDLSVKTGAADVTVRFDAPNLAAMRAMTLEAGAAQLKLVHGANAGADRVTANVGVGSIDLDFTGPLANDVDISASVALGDLTVRASPDVGVFVDAKTFLGDLSDSGLTKRGDGWYSVGYEKATRHVRVRLRAFVGGFSLRRTAE
ncbi:MAG: hypothetical protein HYR75_01555 [Gemmatimonadetes bacterium]|nr:hypothetical protein [Gemmatimonadota bacterium]MBI3566666.1 hypothetical protein [Gemmatimonadota bacterium]